MLRLPTPDVSYGETTITLGGETYVFVYRYNERQSRWHLDIYDSFENLIKANLTIVEDSIINGHLLIPELDGALLYVDKVLAGDDRCGRNNLGIGKTHELVYVEERELS